MPPKLTKAILGAIVAVALAAAVSYGLISQQTADQIQTQANQTLQTDQPSNGTVPPSSPAPQTPAPQTPAPTAPTQPGTAPQTPAPAAR